VPRALRAKERPSPSRFPSPDADGIVQIRADNRHRSSHIRHSFRPGWIARIQKSSRSVKRDGNNARLVAETVQEGGSSLASAQAGPRCGGNRVSPHTWTEPNTLQQQTHRTYSPNRPPETHSDRGFVGRFSSWPPRSGCTCGLSIPVKLTAWRRGCPPRCQRPCRSRG
jgi:hypothetical protein